MPNRKPNRLPGYDYSTSGAYYVTICLKKDYAGKNFFGEIKDRMMILNKKGILTEESWKDIPNHYEGIILDEYCIMPDHIHGIIWIDNDPELVGTGHRTVHNENSYPKRGQYNVLSLHNKPRKIPQEITNKNIGKLSKIIRSFKITVNKKLRRINEPGIPWKRSFFDHIIRDEKGLNMIREYVKLNPSKWETGDYNYDEWKELFANDNK